MDEQRGTHLQNYRKKAEYVKEEVDRMTTDNWYESKVFLIAMEKLEQKKKEQRLKN